MLLVYFYIIGSVLLVSFVSFAGALGIFIGENRFKNLLTFFLSLAVGALLGDAFFHLIPEAFKKINSPEEIAYLILGGIIFVFIMEKFLRWHHHSEEQTTIAHRIQETQPPRHLGQLVLFSDGLHNLLDGIIIAISYLVNFEIGIATTIAVVLHEIPQEIGDLSVLLYAGYKKTTALFYNLLSALSAVVGAIIILLLGNIPESLILYGLTFAAGIFIYIASADLVPELHRKTKREDTLFQFLGLIVGIGAMYLLLFLEQ